MKTTVERNVCALVGVAAVAALLLCQPSPARSEGANGDVCQEVPGATVAQAIKGKVVQTRSAAGRCVYSIAVSNNEADNKAFVVYRHPAGDYDGLREVQEGEVTKVAGLGDEAVVTYDREAKRYWLLVVKRGKVTLQVSGDDQEQVRQVAAAALAKYSAP